MGEDHPHCIYSFLGFSTGRKTAPSRSIEQGAYCSANILTMLGVEHLGPAAQQCVAAMFRLRRDRLPWPFNGGPVCYNDWQFTAASFGWGRRPPDFPLAVTGTSDGTQYSACVAVRGIRCVNHPRRWACHWRRRISLPLDHDGRRCTWNRGHHVIHGCRSNGRRGWRCLRTGESFTSANQLVALRRLSCGSGGLSSNWIRPHSWNGRSRAATGGGYTGNGPRISLVLAHLRSMPCVRCLRGGLFRNTVCCKIGDRQRGLAAKSGCARSPSLFG